MSDFIGTDSLFRFQIEKHEKIKMNFNYFPNIGNGSEILKKVSAIKSEIMFINQELSIQSLDENSDR
jgi:ACT domain-containing protein